MRIFHFCSQLLSIFQFVFAIVLWCNCLFYYLLQWGQRNVAEVSVRKRNDRGGVSLLEVICTLLIFGALFGES